MWKRRNERLSVAGVFIKQPTELIYRIDCLYVFTLRMIIENMGVCIVRDAFPLQ